MEFKLLLYKLILNFYINLSNLYNHKFVKNHTIFINISMMIIKYNLTFFKFIYNKIYNVLLDIESKMTFLYEDYIELISFHNYVEIKKYRDNKLTITTLLNQHDFTISDKLKNGEENMRCFYNVLKESNEIFINILKSIQSFNNKSTIINQIDLLNNYIDYLYELIETMEKNNNDLRHLMSKEYYCIY